MTENIKELYCPICKSGLARINFSLACKNGHTFDISSSGYVNLNTKGAQSGDSKEMAKARSRFLDGGYYEKFAEGVKNVIGNYKHDVIVDAGCGEGYYSVYVAEKLENTKIFGFDLSKPSVEKAAKRAKAAQTDAGFFVGGIFDMPIENESSDVVMNLFAPCADREFYRILKPGGILVMGVAGKNHLLGLKRAIYNDVYLNDPEKVTSPEGFSLCENIKVNYNIKIKDNQSISDLFTMTPYYWKTSKSDSDKLYNLTELETELDFEIIVFKKS